MKRLNKEEKNEVIDDNIFLINRIYLCDYFLNINIPIDIRVLILRFSGHIRQGKRSLQWVLF